MNTLLRRFMGFVLVGFVLTGAVWAEDKAVDPKLRDEVVAAIKLFEEEGPEEYQLMELWQKSGASYMKELTAPASKADSYVDEEQQRVMVGVYLLNMNYAQVFKRYRDAKQYAEALDLLLGKLGYRNRELQRSYQEIVESSDSMDKEKLYRKLDEVVDRVWEEYVDTERGLDLAVDGLYGWLIEGLYLACEVTAQQDYDAAFLAFLNEQMNYFKSMEKTLLLFEQDSALAGTVEKSERLQMVQQVINQLCREREMSAKEVSNMRKMIAQARADLIH